MKKRIWSFLMMLCLLANFLPTTVLAESTVRDSADSVVDSLLFIYFDATGTEQSVSLLPYEGSVLEIPLVPSFGYTFEVSFKETEAIHQVYIASTIDEQTVYLEAVYDEEKDAYVTEGFFQNDSKYVPGDIRVAYSRDVSSTVVTDEIELSDFQVEAIHSNQVYVSATADYSLEASVPISTMLETMDDVYLNAAIDVFEESYGLGALDDWLGTYKDLDQLSSYLLKGKDDEQYILYLDYSEPDTYAMILKDVTGNKFTKMTLKAFAENQIISNVGDIADSLSETHTVAGLFYDYYAIASEGEQLRTEINSNTSLTAAEKVVALEKTDNLTHDKQMFSLITTVLPLIVAAPALTSTAMASAPALLFSALLSGITATSDYFWAHRIGLIQEGTIQINCFASGRAQWGAWNAVTAFWMLDNNGILAFQGTGTVEAQLIDTSFSSHKAFRNETETITGLIVGEGISAIGAGAFSSAYDNLVTAEFPESLQTIGGQAFYGSGLQSICIPSSVAEIGTSAFSNCKNLKEVAFASNSSLTDISQYMFYKCTNLEELVLPTHITSIGAHAFDSCTKLTKIILPEKLTTIGQDSFRQCKNLTEIFIPDSVSTIGTNAFYECFQLGYITIPSGISRIEPSTFYHCVNLTKVSVPNSVTEIGDAAFDTNGAITDVYYEGTEAQWNQIIIGEDNEDLTNATIHLNSALDMTGTLGENCELQWQYSPGFGYLRIIGEVEENEFLYIVSYDQYDRMCSIARVIDSDEIAELGDSTKRIKLVWLDSEYIPKCANADIQ